MNGKAFRRHFASFSAAIVLAMLAANPSRAAFVLTFEGLQDNEEVLNYYNGGLGGNGSGPGPNDGVTFSSNALALIQSSAGGTGNTSGLPSPPTSLYFLSGSAATINMAAGFTTGFSFYYSAIHNAGVINVYSGVNDTGTLLATLNLPVTPSMPPPAFPSEAFSPFYAIGVSFSGTAKSIDFGGTENQITFDNITFGSATPMVPEPSSLLLLGTSAAVGLLIKLRSRRRVPA